MWYHPVVLLNKILESEVSSLQNTSVRKPNRKVWLVVIPCFFSCLILESLVFPRAEIYLPQQNLYETVCIMSKSTLSVYPINSFLFHCFWWNKNDLSHQRLLKPITEGFHFSKLFQLCNKDCFFLPQSSASCSAQGVMLSQLSTPFKKNLLY